MHFVKLTLWGELHSVKVFEVEHKALQGGGGSKNAVHFFNFILYFSRDAEPKKLCLSGDLELEDDKEKLFEIDVEVIEFFN